MRQEEAMAERVKPVPIEEARKIADAAGLPSCLGRGGAVPPSAQEG